MKAGFKHILLLIFFSGFSVVFWACQEDEERLLSEPRIQMFFINQDSLEDVQDTLVEVSDSLVVIDTLLTYYSDSASIVFDSLIQLGILIQEGQDELQPRFDSLTDERERLTTEFEATEDLDSIMNESRKQWTEVESTINSGEVLVSSITNRVNSKRVEYEDSSTLWYLPVSMNEDEVFTSIELDGQFYDLDVSYERLITVNEFNNVIVETQNISITNDDFIRIEFDCQDCKGREATFIIYF